MSWNPNIDFHYMNSASYPYNSAGSFMEYVEGLTYEHVNFIFDGSSHFLETLYPPASANFYKFGMVPAGISSYYDPCNAYEIHDHAQHADEFRRGFDDSSTVINQQAAAVSMDVERNENITTHEDPIMCLRRQHAPQNYQVMWQDNIDPDNMTYEELLELGDSVGTQSRGLSNDLISLLPVSKYKRSFFARRKSRTERCVICQMEYKRGDLRITLPCKHVYHVGCGTKWLSINKACPICYAEVFSDASKQ